MDIKEIKNKSVAELTNLLEELRLKLDELKYKAAQKQLKNIREVRMIKREIAKIMTVLKQNQLKDKK